MNLQPIGIEMILERSDTEMPSTIAYLLPCCVTSPIIPNEDVKRYLLNCDANHEVVCKHHRFELNSDYLCDEYYAINWILALSVQSLRTLFGPPIPSRHVMIVIDSNNPI